MTCLDGLISTYRVTPCIMFHITATAPAVWVLELTEVEKRLLHRELNETDKPFCVPIDPVTQGRKEPFEDISDWVNH